MMEGDKTMVRIDRKSSIVSEPRTLTMDQTQNAREAALYVLNTRSIEEAMSIFTKGLQPVGSEAGRNGDTMMDTSRQIQYLEDDDDLRLPEIKDISSAPF